MSKKKETMYVNIWDYKRSDMPFNIFIGGRGTGKTYGALKGAVEGECDGNFLLMRRTNEEFDVLCDSDQRGEGVNPFKTINTDCNYNYGLKKLNKKIAGIYERESDAENQGKYNYVGLPLGYATALSSIATIRSMDMSDVTDIIYDEFIPERHVRMIKNEGEAFLNAYETINRNREFNGKPAVKAWLLSNSNNIYNDILNQLGLISIVERMIARGQHDKYLTDRGIAIHLVESQALADKKSQTALYRATSGTRFADMALGNKFAYNDFSLIGHRKISEYRPLIGIDIAYIYKHKSRNEYYVSYAEGKCQHYNSSFEQEKRKFCQKAMIKLVEAYTDGRIIFESYELKELILDIIM